MGQVWRVMLLALIANGILATFTFARPVYLADGGIVEAQTVWQEDDKIYVLLNRDSLITFYSHELDLKKTFASKSRYPTRKPAKSKAKAGASSTAATPKTTPSPAKTVEKPATPVTPAAPTVKPAPPPPATPPKAVAPAAVGTPPPSSSKVTPAATTSVPASAAPAKATASAPLNTPPQATQPKATPPPAVSAASSVAPPQPVPPPPAAKPKPAPRQAITPPAAIPQLAQLDSGGAGLLVVLAGILAFGLLMIVSLWKVFTKAGQAGWKCLIPIYNLIVLLKIADCPLWWFLMFFIPIVGLWFTVVMHIKLAERFGKGPLFGFGLCFLGFIFFPILAFDGSIYGWSMNDSMDDNFEPLV